MTKAEIRKSASKLRDMLSLEEVQKLSSLLLDRFITLDFSAVRTIHLFIPIIEKKEPDTFLIIDWLRAHHPLIKIIVPKADFDTALMSHYEYPGKEKLIKNLYNILEPEKGSLHTGEVDMVLVPLLAFDKRGYRVGYGKGFYDRFLEPIQTKKIGISLFDAVEVIEDVHENDVRLDCCLTPDHIIYF